MKDTFAELNPAAMQRQIQALTAELLTLTTSKAAATTVQAVARWLHQPRRPAVMARTGRAPAQRAAS